MFPTFVEYCDTNLTLNLLKINIDLHFCLSYSDRFATSAAKLASEFNLVLNFSKNRKVYPGKYKKFQ